MQKTNKANKKLEVKLELALKTANGNLSEAMVPKAAFLNGQDNDFIQKDPPGPVPKSWKLSLLLWSVSLTTCSSHTSPGLKLCEGYTYPMRSSQVT